MSPQNMKEVLIERTIKVIAEEGLDKTTTKAIVAGTGINEAYIYRHFSDKEHLLSKTFEELDHELFTKMMQHVSVMYERELEYQMRCRAFFIPVWNFLLSNKEKCVAYVRYYYSPYFLKYSIKEHKERYEPLIEKFKDAFKDEADVWMILNHILNVLLDFATKAHTIQMPKDDSYSEHVFRVIYASVKQYFKRTEESEF